MELPSQVLDIKIELSLSWFRSSRSKWTGFWEIFQTGHVAKSVQWDRLVWYG